MGMPLSTVSDPIAASFYLTWLAHTTRAKNSTPVMCLSWTPGGRRLLTGNQEGEFTLWDGNNFSFELIMSAHDTSFRSMAWSHNRNYLLTSDAGGNIKYWSPSIAPVQSLDSHNNQAIHALSFSPSDTKFVSGGDDATVRVWDWASHREERILEGHGWDVKVRTAVNYVLGFGVATMKRWRSFNFVYLLITNATFLTRPCKMFVVCDYFLTRTYFIL